MVAKLENNQVCIKVNEKGGELSSLYRKDCQTEFLWQADSKFWGRHAPVLFPIVGMLNNGKTVIKGKEYKMGQHGFARDMVHQLTEESKSHLTFTLHSNADTLAIYPYEFELSTQYTLLENGVAITYNVKNPSLETIYFSIGAHPAFNWPLFAEEKKEDYFLEFEKEENQEKVEFESGYITGKKTPFLTNTATLALNDQLFKNDAIILKNLRSNYIKLKSKSHAHYLMVTFYDFPYLGLWTKPGNPFVCIEPWFGVADNKNSPRPFVDKEGVLRLEPNKNFQCKIQYLVY